MPDTFTGDTSDTFTEKMIREFAVEAHDKDTGLPNGIFSLSKEQTKEAAYEVLATHLGYKTKKE